MASGSSSAESATRIPAPPDVGITNRPNTNQYEEVELDRRDTITLQTLDNQKITTNQLFAYIDNLQILDDVYQIYQMADTGSQLHEITVKAGIDIFTFAHKLFDKPIIIDGKTIRMTSTRKLKDTVLSLTIKVMIYEAPCELKDEYILRKLSQYGEQQKNQVIRHKYRGFEILNGIRSVNFKKITKPIPTTLFVRGNQIRLKHENQDRTPVCGICKTRGHFRLDCPQLPNLQRHVDLDQPPEDPSEDPITTWAQAREKMNEKQEKRQKELQEEQMEAIRTERERRQKEADLHRREMLRKKRPGPYERDRRSTSEEETRQDKIMMDLRK